MARFAPQPLRIAAVAFTLAVFLSNTWAAPAAAEISEQEALDRAAECNQANGRATIVFEDEAGNGDAPADAINSVECEGKGWNSILDEDGFVTCVDGLGCVGPGSRQQGGASPAETKLVPEALRKLTPRR